VNTQNISAPKLKKGTVHILDGKTVFVFHDNEKGSVVVSYFANYADEFVVDREDLKPFIAPRSQPNKVSTTRAKENREYLAKRKVFLDQNKRCEANVTGCTKFATTVHHPAGRIGKKLTDESLFVALCGNCHTWVENNPDSAKEMGLSINRL
jgi:hypothetical protein